ncbi:MULTISPECIES: SDR family oxidoreductase [unclassified Streptomyces]|uniref:SDR family oxidoreductase n=1 Tax=unclassified Streptomyces TaxID=2593676 RepID=UPI00278BD768|nr:MULTISPECIES: SDR family oxidoreductase [unclassified Streptomyces]
MSTIAVTGAGSGMGATLTERLRAQGHTVIGVDLKNADVTADLGTPEGRAHAVAEITRISGGRLDGFLPFAGITGGAGRPSSLLVSVNYFGAIRLVEGLRPALAATGNASVVFASSNSTTTQPDWPERVATACLAGDEAEARRTADEAGADDGGIGAYPATKAALAWYARTRAAEYQADGIRLNAVAPGYIDTPMTRAAAEDPATAEGIKQFLASIPAGRAGTAEEIAELVEFLLSPKSSYCVGSVFYADGGLDAGLRATDWPKVWHPRTR